MYIPISETDRNQKKKKIYIYTRIGQIKQYARLL